MTHPRSTALTRAKLLAAGALVAATVATGAVTVELAVSAGALVSTSDDSGSSGFRNAQPVQGTQGGQDTTTRGS